MVLEKVNSGTFYIVSTPIGHIKDITLRALEVIKQVDILLVEDTRSIQYLTKFYKIEPKRIISYHSQNEPQRIPLLLEMIKSYSIALVSEAGTPLINDPGYLLVGAFIKENIPIVAIPGVTALTAALPLSGFPLSEFYFLGFLSSKEGKKRTQLESLVSIKTIIAFYESPHRIEKTMQALLELFPENTPLFIARELTKTYETLYRGSIKDIFDLVISNNFVCKGEFVIIINNNAQSKENCT